ncbi:hypothetical protein QQS21_005834 [Conoideocrella luteorostrata]|uniref:laccase n=1 Tax=Conoideocrella luteorostrata TaxID=1105319 RepID=A0AAJ0FYT5_9HYPO|nr:hypothetical protein QQS21_005834 [Conoideocrella luteorostrata]
MIRRIILIFLAIANICLAAFCPGNDPDGRSVWCDHSILTDYHNEFIDTGITRTYYLEITDATVAPDGHSRPAMLVNGSLPGPTIIADWGDTVVVHVTNKLTTSRNGTTIHFHGIRQHKNNQNDGVPSITQCPIPVNSSMTYTWKATQYGSTWYHSHIGLQAWDGVFGGIIINGPATGTYQEDLGMLFLTDWGHQTMQELYSTAERSGPPRLNNGLINGTNVFVVNGTTTGTRFKLSFKFGMSYRLRLVNAAIDTHFKFSIDNHVMMVIASDLVPIEPYFTTVLNIGIGQRYDVVVTADQGGFVASNFWMRAIPQTACSENDSRDNIRGIVYYGDKPGTPETTGYNYTDSCDDETKNLKPFISKDFPITPNTKNLEEVTVRKDSAGRFRWYLNSTTMLVEWGKPTLYSLINKAEKFNSQVGILELTAQDEWVYLIITSTLAVPHPIHLHGHDFHILAQGTGKYSSSTPLNMNNPARRDTAMLPPAGYLVMAWEADNPGVWLLHCHIGWHTSEGFAVQFVERRSEIGSITNSSYVKDMCTRWKAYQSAQSLVQEDSGI